MDTGEVQLFLSHTSPITIRTSLADRNCDNCPQQEQLNKVSCDRVKVHLFTILMDLWVYVRKMSQASKNSMDSNPLTKRL